MKGQGRVSSKVSSQSFFESFDSMSWFFLLALAPLFLFVQPQFSWILLVLPLTWLISLVAKRKPIPVTPYNLTLLIISIQVLVSLYATYDIAFSLQKITGVIWGITIFFNLLRLSKSLKGLLVTSIIYIGGSAGILLLGLLGIEWPTNKIIFFNSLYESIPTLSKIIPVFKEGFHPNEVGGATTWILPTMVIVCFWVILRFNKIKNFVPLYIIIPANLALIFLIGLGTIVLLFSQSRSAYIGIVFGFISLIFFVIPKKFRFLLIILILIGSGFLVYIFQNGQLISLANQLFPESGMASMAFSTSTLSGRVEIWARAIYAIQDFSFTGMGMNTFREVVNVLYPLQTISPDTPIKDIGHAHNLFLQTALDLGIPGLIGFIGMYMVSFWLLISNITRLKNKSTRSSSPKKSLTKEFFLVTSIGLFSSQIAHLAYGMTDAIAFGAKPGIIFWVMQSLICGIYFKVRLHDYN